MTIEEHIQNRNAKEGNKVAAEKRAELRKIEKAVIRQERTVVKNAENVPTKKVIDTDSIKVKTWNSIYRVLDSENSGSDKESISIEKGSMAAVFVKIIKKLNKWKIGYNVYYASYEEMRPAQNLKICIPFVGVVKKALREAGKRGKEKKMYRQSTSHLAYTCQAITPI